MRRTGEDGLGEGVYVGWEGALKGLGGWMGIDLLQTIDHARRGA